MYLLKWTYPRISGWKNLSNAYCQMFYLVSTDKGFEWPSHLHTCCLEEVMDSCRVWAKARSQCEAIHKQPLMIRVCIWFQVLPKSSIPTPRECSATDKKQKTWLLQTLQQKGLKRHTHTHVYFYLNKDTTDCCFVAQFTANQSILMPNMDLWRGRF